MFLRRTPLHPQWFAFLDEPGWLRRVAAACSGTVVDIGSGYQRVRPFLSSACRYIGVDYYTTATSMYHVKPDVYADAASLPFASGSAQTVLLLEVLEHLPDAARALVEANRILSDGAGLVVSAPFVYPVHDAPFDFQRWTPHGLRALLERSGFTIEQTELAGSPIETAALMANIALAQAGLRLIGRFPPAALFVLPLLSLAVPAINLVGWVLARLDHDRDLMPYSCRYRCRKSRPVSSAR